LTGSVDSQTCNYLHDDLARIASANCGTPWSQTFTYDAFGNINKSGSVSFGYYGWYDTTKNQVYSNPATNFYYDANGNSTAVYNSGGLAYYMHSDWLGSSRLASSPSRTVLWSGAYAPFGESYAETTQNNSYHSFTGQNEDTVSGLDDFMFREFSASQQGRW